MYYKNSRIYIKKGFDKVVKKFFCFFLLCWCLGISACGSNETTDNMDLQTSYESEYTYIPSYESFSVDNAMFLEDIFFRDDEMFYCVNNWNEEQEVSEFCIYKREINKSRKVDVLFSYTSNDSISKTLEGFTVLSNNQIAMVVQLENEGDITCMLRIIDATGNLITEEDITSQVYRDEMPNSITKCVSDNSDNIYLLCSDRVLVFCSDGKFLFHVNAKENLIENLIKDDKNNILVIQNVGKLTDISTIDFEKRSYSESYPNLPDNILSDAVVCNGKTEVLIPTSTELVKYNFTDKNHTKVLNWRDYNISSSEIETVSLTTDGNIFLVLSKKNNADETFQICTLKKTLKSEIPTTKTIKLGTIGELAYNLEGAITEFNKTHLDYQIEVVNYIDIVRQNSTVNEDNIYNEAMIKFQNDILLGNAPDIINMTNSGDFELYMKKGIIEDLYPYLEESTLVEKKNLIPNVLEAYTVDGKLACIPFAFTIYSLIGRTSDVGPEEHWTVEQMMEIVLKKPDDMMIMQYATKENILSSCIAYDKERFVNWETGVCYYESEDFKNILEFANMFPSEYEQNYDVMELLSQDKLLLMQAYIFDFTDILRYNLMMQEECTYIGYPTSDEGGGTTISGYHPLAISATSTEKEAAWFFIESLLTEEFQREQDTFLPVSKVIFDEQLEEAMQAEYELDGEGNILLDAEGNPIKVAKGDITYADGSSVQYFEMSKEEAEQLMKLLSSVHRVDMSGDNVIFNIIREEAGAYFVGQKTVDEVAEIIQNRVQLYVNEIRE